MRTSLYKTNHSVEDDSPAQRADLAFPLSLVDDPDLPLSEMSSVDRGCV